MVLENADYLPSSLSGSLSIQQKNGNRQLPRREIKHNSLKEKSKFTRKKGHKEILNIYPHNNRRDK